MGEVLTALTARFPNLKKQLYNDEGKAAQLSFNVYLNDDDIRYLQKDVRRRWHAGRDTLSITVSSIGGRRAWHLIQL